MRPIAETLLERLYRIAGAEEARSGRWNRPALNGATSCSSAGVWPLSTRSAVSTMLCPPKFCVYAYGEAVGVTGTPSFFLDGEKLEVQSFEELVQRMEQAVDA